MLKEINNNIRAKLQQLSDHELELYKQNIPQLRSDIEKIQNLRTKEKAQAKAAKDAAGEDTPEVNEDSYWHRSQQLERSHRESIEILAKIQKQVNGPIRNRMIRLRRAIEGEDQATKKKPLNMVVLSTRTSIKTITELVHSFPKAIEHLYLESHVGQLRASFYYEQQIAPKILKKIVNIVKPLLNYLNRLVTYHETMFDDDEDEDILQENENKESASSPQEEKIINQIIVEFTNLEETIHRMNEFARKQLIKFTDMDFEDHRNAAERIEIPPAPDTTDIGKFRREIENIDDEKNDVAGFRKQLKDTEEWNKKNKQRIANIDDYKPLKQQKYPRVNAQEFAKYFPDKKKKLKEAILNEISVQSARYAKGSGKRAFYNYTYEALSKSLMMNTGLRLDMDAGYAYYEKEGKERKIRIGKYLQYWILGFKKLFSAKSQEEAEKQASIMYHQFGEPTRMIAYALREFERDYLYAQEFSKEIYEDLLDMNHKFGLEKVKGDSEEYVIMITDVPIDVIRMSDFCEQNCHSEGEKEFSSALEEAAYGGEVIYLITKEIFDLMTSKMSIEEMSKGDREVFFDPKRGTGIREAYPVARMRARRVFFLENEMEFLMPTTKYYGDRTTNWEETVFEIYRRREAEKYKIIGDYIKENDGIAYGRDFSILGGSYVDADWEETLKKFFPWMEELDGRIYSSPTEIEEEYGMLSVDELQDLFEVNLGDDNERIFDISVLVEEEEEEVYNVQIDLKLKAPLMDNFDEKSIRSKIKEENPRFPVAPEPFEIAGDSLMVPISYNIIMDDSTIPFDEPDRISELIISFAERFKRALYTFDSFIQ